MRESKNKTQITNEQPLISEEELQSLNNWRDNSYTQSLISVLKDKQEEHKLAWSNGSFAGEQNRQYSDLNAGYCMGIDFCLSIINREYDVKKSDK